jgi:transcriptional regulator with XRE-family HTH domain
MLRLGSAAVGGNMAKSPTHNDILIGAKVRLRRKELGLSQQKLAAALGVTFQQIQKYEKGTNRIGAGRLMEIAGRLSVPITYFFEGLGQAADETIQTAIDVGTLFQPGAIDLLSNFDKIDDPALRKAIQDLTRRLASLSAKGNQVGGDAPSERSRRRGAKRA